MKNTQRENKEVSSDDLIRIGLQLELAAHKLGKENNRETNWIPKVATSSETTQNQIPPLTWTIKNYAPNLEMKKTNNDSQERELVFQNFGRRLTKKTRPEDQYIIGMHPSTRVIVVEFGFK
jgi:hypothetical protein